MFSLVRASERRSVMPQHTKTNAWHEDGLLPAPVSTPTPSLSLSPPPSVAVTRSAIFLKQIFSPLVYLTLVPVVAGVALASLKELDFKVSADLQLAVWMGLLEKVTGVRFVLHPVQNPPYIYIWRRPRR